MAAKVNIKTIGSDLGLSTGTISRVLNGKAKEFRISEETVNLVLKHAKKMGYTPNLIAKGLQASKTFTIGLMIPDIANPFFALMAKNIEKAASDANYSILLVDAEENIEKEKYQTKILTSRNVDGIIAAPVGIVYDHFQEIKAQGTPLIFVDRYFKDVDIPYISSDNYTACYEATKLLISNGHKRIALIKGNAIIEPVRERRRGFEDAMKEGEAIFDENLIIGNDFTIENGYESANKLFAMADRPTAIFAMSNLIGLGVLKSIEEHHLIAPEDVSLIFFDNQPYASFLNPPITTIKQNSIHIGELAMEFILKKIDDDKTELESRLIPTEIILRKSIKDIR